MTAGRSAWRDTDVVTVTITALLGAIAIVGAWFGAGGAGSPTQQAMWLNVAVAGFAVSGVGFGLWLMRGRRAGGERRSALVSLEPAVDEPAAAPARPRPDGTTAPLQLVRAPGMRRVHAPDCPLMHGKPMEPATVADGDRCAVCQP